MHIRPSFIALLALLAAPLHAAPGDVEAGFNPNVGTEGNLIYGTATQFDGKIVLAGGLTSVGGVSRSRIARLHPDGTLDTAFNPNSAGAIRSVTLLPDGKILLAGEMNSIGGTGVTRLARLNPNGSLDNTFSASANDYVYSTAVQTDGRLVIGGLFTTVNGVARSGVARLLSNGALDTTFNPNPNAQVRTIAIQPDGKIIIAGTFTGVGGTPRNLLARVSGQGVLDADFDAAIEGSTIYTAAVQPDGRILFGGTFTKAGNSTRLNIARLTATGALDEGFDPGTNGVVRTFSLQTDGKCVIAGDFTTAGGAARNRLARLQPDGTLDTAFNPNADNTVFSAALAADGRIVAGGNFLSMGGATRRAVARLLNDPATQSLTVSGTDRLRWLRGGASPETHQVTFELSTDGGSAWTPLGSGTRIAGGWERSALTLPLTGQIRARARVIGGVYNGSSALVESVTSYAFTHRDLWRQAAFGTMDNTGPAADNADPDKDGLENLVEYALALNPNIPDADALPVWERDDDTFVLAFPRPPGVTGITYIAEASPTMAPGSWVPALNAGTAPSFVFFVQTAAPRLYLRLRITAP